jgi:hypothetical protein
LLELYVKNIIKHTDDSMLTILSFEVPEGPGYLFCYLSPTKTEISNNSKLGMPSKLDF